MKDYLLEYSLELVRAVRDICAKVRNERNVISQISRSSSSVYANIREAKYAQSDADMISKFEIALKEVYETEGWLQVLRVNKYCTYEVFRANRNLCGRIRRMLIASIKTLKNR